MKEKLRSFAGTVILLVAVLLLGIAAIETAAFVVRPDAFDPLIAAMLGSGLLLGLVAAFLRRDFRLFHRLILLPVNLGSAFLLLGATSPMFLGEQTSLGLTVVCVMLLVAGLTTSIRSQVKSQSRANTHAP